MPSKPANRARPAVAPAAMDVSVTRVGADGDGIGTTADGQTAYVPFTLPGDAIRVRDARRHGQGWLAAAETWSAHGPDRVEPPCPHFGACGGCALQHWAPPAYAAWKTNLLRSALKRAGFDDGRVEPMVETAGGGRRRMDLAARRPRGGAIVGLHRMRSAEVVDLSVCPVLHPALSQLLPGLRAMMGALAAPWRQASIIVNLLDAGPDLLIGADTEPSAADRVRLAAFAGEHGLPRVAWARDAELPESVAQLRPAVTSLSGVIVAPPPGAFLQATEAGERAIIRAVLAGLPDRIPPRAPIAEFHAGCGTLTFALVQRAPVRAWEGDAASVAALSQAANHANLAGRIRAERRDLARQPLQARELKGFAAVVLDPPHTGAVEQMGPIAASDIGTVIYVSCNPAALGRDSAILHAGGFRLERSTPIDQFLWSPRLESVSVFRRDRG